MTSHWQLSTVRLVVNRGAAYLAGTSRSVGRGWPLRPLPTRLRGTIQLRIIPDKVSGMAEIRFWHDNKLVSIEKVKNEDLKLVHF